MFWEELNYHMNATIKGPLKGSIKGPFKWVRERARPVTW